MNKLLIAGMGFIFIINAFANPTLNDLTKENIEKINKEYLAKIGIDIPTTIEVSIVSADKYIKKSALTHNKDDMYMAKKMQEYLAMNKEQEKNGYVKDNEPRAKELMQIKHIAPYHKNKYKGVLSSESTHLRNSINELKLAYTFVGVPPSDIDRNLGVAPYGAYKQIKNGDDGDGWDGAVQFFEKKDIGSCAFTEHNRKLAHSGVELIKELVTYEVNNEPTLILIKGTKESGFVYTIKWYSPIFSRELECANTQFSGQIRSEIIALANRIEAYQNQ